MVVCTVRGTFAPGQRHELRGGLATVVGPATLGDKRITQIVEPLATAGPLPSGVRLKHREADQALRLRAVGKPLDVIPVEVAGAGGQTYLRAVHGAFDIVAQGAAVTGAVGDTVQVTVGIRNEGPGVPDGTNSGDTVGAFYFTPPTGVTVLANPGCWPTHSEEDGGEAPKTWYCDGQRAVFTAGTSNTATFDLRIDSLGGAAGEVQPYGRYPRVDDDPSNDIAPVTVG